MNTESTLESIYEAHAAELARLKADYTRELNAKLEQINKQAETIRDEREQKLLERKTAREYANDLQSERERHEADLGMLRATKETLLTQLLFALAAIEQVKSQVQHFEFALTIEGREILHEHDKEKHIESYHQGYNDACTMIYENPTEAQLEHDAEVRKPLVDTLGKVRQRFPVAANTNQLAIVELIDDALAKVKESK